MSSRSFATPFTTDDQYSICHVPKNGSELDGLTFLCKFRESMCSFAELASFYTAQGLLWKRPQWLYIMLGLLHLHVKKHWSWTVERWTIQQLAHQANSDDENNGVWHLRDQAHNLRELLQTKYRFLHPSQDAICMHMLLARSLHSDLLPLRTSGATQHTQSSCLHLKWNIHTFSNRR